MTYDDLLKTQAALEAALLSGASHVDVTIGDRRVSYHSLEEINKALALVNRSLCRYNRKAKGVTNPAIVTPVFTHYG